MSLRIKTLLSALSLCAAFVSTNANAIIYNITGEVDITNNPFDIFIDVAGTTVNSVSGTFDAANITGIANDFLGPNFFTSAANYSFAFDIAPASVAGDSVRVFTVDSYVVGTAGGTSSATFSLSNVSVAAVPEPETYAMFLAGLGLLGFARRSKKF